MGIKKFPELYKRISKEAIYSWHIAVDGPIITITQGKVGGTLSCRKWSMRDDENPREEYEMEAGEWAKKAAEFLWAETKKSGYTGSITDAERQIVERDNTCE